MYNQAYYTGSQLDQFDMSKDKVAKRQTSAHAQVQATHMDTIHESEAHAQPGSCSVVGASSLPTQAAGPGDRLQNVQAGRQSSAPTQLQQDVYVPPASSAYHYGGQQSNPYRRSSREYYYDCGPQLSIEQIYAAQRVTEQLNSKALMLDFLNENDRQHCLAEQRAEHESNWFTQLMYTQMMRMFGYHSADRK